MVRPEIRLVWKQLQGRSTIHRSDETVCLSIMLGSDTKPILDIASDSLMTRMVTLISMMRNFPLLQVPSFNLVWMSLDFAERRNHS